MITYVKVGQQSRFIKQKRFQNIVSLRVNMNTQVLGFKNFVYPQQGNNKLDWGTAYVSITHMVTQQWPKPNNIGKINNIQDPDSDSIL